MTASLPAPTRWTLVALALGLALSISLSEVAFATLGVLLFLGPRWRAPALKAPLIAPVLAFAGWTIVTALASGHAAESLRAAKGLVWLGVIYVMVNTLPDGATARRFATLLFVTTTIAAVAGIVQTLACPAEPPRAAVLAWFFDKCGRAHAFFSIYMTLAGVLIVVLIATLPRLLARSLPLGWAVPAWLVGVIALDLTYVRSAWLGFALGGALSALGPRRRVLVLIGIAAIVVATAVELPGVLARARTIGSLRDETTRDRLAMWTGGLHMAREHPILGVGTGGVKRLYPSYAPPEALRHSTSHLHDTPLQILVERGTVGLALWLWLFGAFFVRAARIVRRLPPDALHDRALVLGSIAAVVGFLVAGLFEYNFGDTEVLFVALVVMAFPFVVEPHPSVEAP